MGHALKRRTTIIPFKFSPPNPDDDLKVKLLEELSGIFFWALQGLAFVAEGAPRRSGVN